MKEARQCEQTLDSTQSLTNPSLSVAGSFVTGLETSSPLHQSKPVCAKRKLAGFADKSIFVAPTQTQTRDGFSFDIISQSDLTETPLFNVSESVRTRTTQVSDTGTSQSTSTGRNSYGTEIGTRYRYIDETPLVPFSENGNSASSTSAAGAKTRSRPSNEYVLYSYGEPVAVSADGNASYFGTDILGSVRNITDKYGAVEANYNYDVFGSPYLSNLDHDIGFGYCGKVYDNGTGLYDYGFRDYSPNQARFTTVDPIRDGSNWFSYVVNDPVNYIDPFGLTSTDVKNYTYQGERDGRRYYTAKPEATMWGLANDTGTDLGDVQGYDGDPHRMPIGTELSIPAKPSTPTPPSQPAPSAPAPAAPAPAAPAPTVPTPSAPSAPPVSITAPPAPFNFEISNAEARIQSNSELLNYYYTERAALDKYLGELDQKIGVLNNQLFNYYVDYLKQGANDILNILNILKDCTPVAYDINSLLIALSNISVQDFAEFIADFDINSRISSYSVIEAIRNYSYNIASINSEKKGVIAQLNDLQMHINITKENIKNDTAFVNQARSYFNLQ